VNLKKAHLMAGPVTHIDSVLLGIIAILNINLEDKPLLSDRIGDLQGNSQRCQRNDRYKLAHAGHASAPDVCLSKGTVCWH
jgi:hypothetical protein